MKRALTTMASVIILMLTGCSANSSTPEVSESDATATGEEATLNVLAAASLQKSLEEISEEFTAQHPDVTIDFNFAGSATLVHNLDSGSPADILASADELNMDKAEQAHLIDADTRTLFASNTLVGIVPVDNPAQVSNLQEATANGVNLVICAPQVPCGALSQRLAEAVGVNLQPASEEQQVVDVLGKVRSGQADAGLVYATDAALAPNEVSTFEIEGADEELNYYPIARTANSEHPDVAETFIEFVKSDTGRSILEAHGFTTP